MYFMNSVLHIFSHFSISETGGVSDICGLQRGISVVVITIQTPAAKLAEQNDTGVEEIPGHDHGAFD